MKHLIIALCILVGVSFAQANQGDWRKVSSKSELAVTPFGIKKLMNHWNYKSLFVDIQQRAITSILVGEDPGTLDRVDIEIRTYKWEGQTTCPPNDPRLYVDVLGYTACWANTNGCEVSSFMIVNRDPCLK